mgnify:FL=1
MRRVEHVVRGNGTVFGRAGNWLALLTVLVAFSPPPS